MKITGTKYLDEVLADFNFRANIGDKVIIPGGDNFSKAIQIIVEPEPVFQYCHLFYQDQGE